MKKNLDKKEDNIVLDEESKKDEKKKPTVKKIVFATILILLAVGFVVLGLCLCVGAFDRLPPSSCNVAYAAVINDNDNHIGKQFYSGITFDNYTSNDLNNVYGFFVNQNFVYDESTCPFYDSFTESEYQHEIPLFSYTIDGIGFNFKADVASANFDGVLRKGFMLSATDNAVGGDFYWAYLSPLYLEAQGVTSLPILFCGKYLDFGENHIENFQFTSEGLQYKDYIGSIINFSYAFSSGGISEDEYNNVVTQLNTLQSQYNNLQTDYNAFMDYYNNKFSYVPIIYNSPTDSVTLVRKHIDKDTKDTIFILNENVPITDIIDNEGNLIYNIQPDKFDSGLWARYWTMNSFNDFHAFLEMANSTPLSYSNGERGVLYSYDNTYHRLTKYSSPITFKDVEDEQLYKDIKQQHINLGKSTAESDKQSTIDGILSVLQSPVDFLKNIFSFEIFGINVAGVVFFIISVVIVAFVIKKVV